MPSEVFDYQMHFYSFINSTSHSHLIVIDSNREYAFPVFWHKVVCLAANLKNKPQFV